MMVKYDYLKKYLGPHNHIIETWRENSFLFLEEGEIENAEQTMGIKFPEELKDFWQEIGGGHITVSKKGATKDYACYYANRILFPREIASILTQGIGSEIITEEGLEYLKEGDIPFFEIADHMSYFTMKPSSDNPNAVYDIDGKMIEPSLEQFVWNLYHVSPIYYLNKR